MEKLSLHLILLDGGYQIAINPITDESWNMYIQLASIFGEFDENTVSITITPVHISTKELKKDIKEFTNEHAAKFPQLNAFEKKIRDINEGEYFLVLPSAASTTREKLDLELYLAALNEANDNSEVIGIFNKKQAEYKELFDDILNEYNFISPRVDKRTAIGERKKSERVCRFCQKTQSDGVTFKKTAHAIPEGLGNKNLIINEECDVCNSFFGDEIEPSLIENLDVLRVSLGIKGKKGLPTINYNNGKMYFGDRGMVIQSKDIEGDPEIGLTIKLKSSKRYTPIKTYKALCKIALSVVDSDQLPYLKQTFEWLKCFDEMPEVPRIAVNVVNSGFTKVPTISLFTKKSDNSQLPHIIGEFKLGTFIYVFIIPFSDKDILPFTEKDDYQRFWLQLKHYQLASDWCFDDYNSYQEVVVHETIKFIKNEQEA